MERRWEQCNGDLLEGVIAGMSGIFFYPEDEIKKFKPKRSQIVCDCCKECGNLQGFRVKDLAELK